MKSPVNKAGAMHFTGYCKNLSSTCSHFVTKVGSDGFVRRVRLIRCGIRLCGADRVTRTTSQIKYCQAERSDRQQRLGIFQLIYLFLSLDLEASLGLITSRTFRSMADQALAAL